MTSGLRLLPEVYDDHRAWAQNPQPRIGTGFSFFDSRTNGGAAQSEVIQFLARSGVGKTTIGLNVISHNNDVPTVFFSLEMAARHIAAKLAAIHTYTPTEVIEREVREHGWHESVNQTVKDFPKLAIVDTPALSIKDMVIHVNEASKVFGEPVRLVVVDYLELIGGQMSLDSIGQVAKTARKMKDFARMTETVVLLLHQVGRGNGGSGADPIDTASGKYGGEEAADYLLGAYRPALEKGITQDQYMRVRDQIMLQFLKTRGGSELHPEGKLHYFEPHSMKITEWDKKPEHGPYMKANKNQHYDQAEMALVGAAGYYDEPEDF